MFYDQFVIWPEYWVATLSISVYSSLLNFYGVLTKDYGMYKK